MEVWTIKKLLDWTKNYFEKANIDSPLLDAQVLLSHALHMNRIQLMLNADKPISTNERSSFRDFVIRRAKNHEPVAYIIGKKEFWSLDFKVSPAVLIPRPDTECLVEKTLEFVEHRLHQKKLSWFAAKNISYEIIVDNNRFLQQNQDVIEKTPETPTAAAASEPPEYVQQKLTIIDVGTGSGAIALSLASEIPETQRDIYAIDISTDALAIAQWNAKNLNLLKNISFLQNNLLENWTKKADIIVSNPPYITTDEMKSLMPDVKCEPILALEAGKKGLDIYEKLIPQAHQTLNDNGLLIVEIGSKQSHAVESLFRQSGFQNVMTFRDYAGLPRIVAGLKI